MSRRLSLSPHGESGLKFHIHLCPSAYRASLPAWGEWIEIVRKFLNIGTERKSLPAWGEWIEICGLRRKQRK